MYGFGKGGVPPTLIRGLKINELRKKTWTLGKEFNQNLGAKLS